MLEKTRRTIQKSALIPKHSQVVVAVSGGADSLALLHVLYTLRQTLGCSLHVATLDHGLRGEAGRTDAVFVARTAESLGIPAIVGQVDVRALAEREHIGIEAAARLARYDFLAEVARQVGAERVAVAHHAGDQAETVLMHLIRGAGLNGLGGMAIESLLPGHADLRLIRPLLQVTRQEIEAYCQENDLKARQDATNADTTYLRNYIRHETLPHLEQLNPHIQQSLRRLADIAQVENDYVTAQLEAFLHRADIEIAKGQVTIPRDAFRALHPALARRLVAWAAQQVHPGIETDYEHIVDAVALGLSCGQGAVGLLSAGTRLRVDYQTIFIEHGTAVPASINQPLMLENMEVRISVPGETLLPDSEWVLVASEIRSEPAARLIIPEGAEVRLRTRREGDRFAPLGMEAHSQKLNRWMINRKIPLSLRGQIPLLTVNGEVAAICINEEWFIADKYAVRPNGNAVIYFYFRHHS